MLRLFLFGQFGKKKRSVFYEKQMESAQKSVPELSTGKSGKNGVMLCTSVQQTEI